MRNNAPFRKTIDPDGEGIDDFEALCTIAEGHKRSQSTAAGRLGFKCVYLITDRPKIHSGPWNFEIKSACIPTEVPAPDDLTPGATRILLPLAQGVKEEQDPTGERLVDLMPFLRQVNHLELGNTNGASRSIRSETEEFISSNDVNVELERVRLAGVEHVREGVVNFIRFRSKNNPAQLGLYIDPEGYPPGFHYLYHVEWILL